MWLVFFPVYSRFECTPVDRCVWFAVAEQQCALRLENNQPGTICHQVQLSRAVALIQLCGVTLFKGVACKTQGLGVGHDTMLNKLCVTRSKGALSLQQWKGGSAPYNLALMLQG